MRPRVTGSVSAPRRAAASSSRCNRSPMVASPRTDPDRFAMYPCPMPIPAVVFRSLSRSPLRYRPACVLLAEQVVGRDGDVVEELLAEVGLAVDLQDRFDRDPGVVAEGHDEHRQPSVLRHAGVGAGEHEPMGRDVAPEVHILEPLMTQVSPSRVARVSAPARSEPPEGSDNNCTKISSARRIAGRWRRFWSSVPQSRIVAPNIPIDTAK